MDILSLKKAALLPLAAFALAGCSAEMDLDGKSDVELCVDAHLALNERVAKEKGKAVDEGAQIAYRPDYYLTCLRASAGK